MHHGKAPRWLFQRMSKLARGITMAVIEEYGPGEMLRRLSDTYWFQAFGCVLGFDWHSSGVTTTVGGALKEGLRGIEKDLGFFVAGGKGAQSRKTPAEIRAFSEKLALDATPLVYASRLAAKVDNAAVQDGFQLYHHHFFFNADGRWCVVQQGMNEETRYARRYHWLGEGVRDFVCEPHAAICSDVKTETLNMVASESAGSRQAAAVIACERPELILNELGRGDDLFLPKRHEIRETEDIRPDYLRKILLRTYERQPENFEMLLGTEGVGPKTIRALSLIGELIHGARPSFRDPARFSYAHGGKDGYPYPVDRALYDRSIDMLQKGLESAKIDRTEKVRALKRLAGFYE